MHNNNQSKYSPIIITKINPKSVSNNALYGYVNILTNEWYDGIIANIIRKASETN